MLGAGNLRAAGNNPLTNYVAPIEGRRVRILRARGGGERTVLPAGMNRLLNLHRPRKMHKKSADDGSLKA